MNDSPIFIAALADLVGNALGIDLGVSAERHLSLGLQSENDRIRIEA